MRKLKNHVLFYLFLVNSLNVNAQPELKFERYTNDQGLVQNYVHCIIQDNYGFMWFGTRDGISRFDGITFKNYYNNNDSCSIGPDWVRTMELDRENRLWIRSGSKLVNFNYETDCFTKYRLSLRKNDENLEKIAYAILCDSKGMLWTTFSGQPVIFNPDTKETIPVPYHTHGEIPDFFAHVIYEDRNKNIWIGTNGKGLFQYNRNDSVYISYKYDSQNPHTISSNSIYCVYEDSRGDIWIGTDKDGLNRYISPSSLPGEKEQKQGSFEKFIHNPNNANSLSHNTVYSICEDAENNLWIGTLNGLCLFDRDSKKFYAYYYDDRDPESLNDNIVRSLYCDKAGDLWVGTRLGVAKLKRNRFKTYSYSSYKNSPSHNKTDYLFVDALQNIFICTPVGIDYFNRKDNTFQVFKKVGKGDKYLSSSPICMAGDPNGYWIGTYHGGLYYYDVITQGYTAYTHNSNDSASLGSNDVFSVCIDSQDTVWVSVLSEGVNVFDKETGKFNRMYHYFGDDNKVICIYEDRDKNIWIGTVKGLYLLDKNTKRFKYYSIDKQKDTNEEFLYVNCLFQSKNGNLWVGTDIGLYRVNVKTGENALYQLEDGLPSLKISSVLEDKNHTIWISTKNGLVRFVPRMEEENKRKGLPIFKIYGKEDGLQSEFLERSSCKLNDGSIAFGGSKGLSIFHPDSIKEDTITPKIAFTNLKIFNKPVNIGEEINGKVILKRSLLTTDTISIHYQNNNFTIEFAAFHYRNSDLNQYAYKLEGYDKEWNYTHVQNRHATYTDLPYKTYTFLLKASNSDGIWSKEAKKLTIHVLPPWWLTLWFKVLVVFVVVSAIIFWFKLKTYKLRKQKKILEERVEHRTRQLKEANQILEESQEELRLQTEQLADMNKELLQTNTNLEVKTIEVENMAKAVHETDQSKLRFFANISHEFRTPLSLIIGPLEKLLKTERFTRQNSVENNYLQLMHRNAKRLFRLINEIIDFRKMDQGEKKLNISNNNIEEFIEEIVGAFSAQAEQKNIRLKIEISKDINRQFATGFWFDPDVMEKILYNLVSNAIKYTPEQGEISVQLSVNNEQSTTDSEQSIVNSNQSYDSSLNTDNCLLITVKDTGIGIKKENLEKIFERFYREGTKENSVIEGTGIGLAYTKELVLLHKGIISVESELGKGSVFTLHFPVGKKHFEKDTISDKSIDVKLEYIHSMIETSERSAEELETFEIEEKDPDGEDDVKEATILLVEDNNDMRKFIKEELETQYEVLEATNGKEGWEMASEFDPFLIVSDIMMPVMDGIELCQKLKNDENTSHIPVILLTAKTGDENTIEGLETGADDYITKPFNIDILKIKVNNLFQLRKRIQKKFSQSLDIVPSEITHSTLDQNFLQKTIEAINENIQDHEFDNDALVRVMRYSRALVYRKIKNLTGQSVSEFIRNIRLKAAAKLLLEGNDNITEVCYLVGFKHPSILTRHFTKMFGSSPKQFLKNSLRE